MSTFKERVKTILVREKILKPEDLESALSEQEKTGGDLSKILVKRGLIDEEQLTFILSEGLELPVINISRLKIDPGIISLISSEVLRKYQILPVSRMGDNLTVAMADPLNIFVIDNIKALTGLVITPIIGRARDIQSAIEQYASPAKQEDSFEKIMRDMKGGDELEFVGQGAERADSRQVEHLTRDAPIVQLTDIIIRQAVAAKASDIFIEPLEKSLRIRYRIDGLVREIDRMSKALHFPIISRIKVISNLDISEHRLPQDGRFRAVVEGGREVDFRVNVLPTALGEKIVMRVLDKNLDRVDIEKLGFESLALERLKEACGRPHGMILACGPTGSGKTTTLYSVLKHIDTPGKNIVTVEDPVEYQMKGLTQVNIRFEVGLTFSSTLRSVLRQDPDVIMIGEIRDSETLDIAVKAALTGHLVLSSLHTTTAPGSVVRMMNMGIEPFLICSSVNCFVAQRLLRRVCSRCKQDVKISETLFEKFDIQRITGKKNLVFSQGKGCSHCASTGYSGRVGIAELLPLTPAIKKLVLARHSELRIKAQARMEGMLTMREDAVLKAVRGLTTLEEVARMTAQDEPLRV
jgi:type IV pilus assembly protein PilB